MKLVDLRRAAIKSGVRVRFSLSNGMECVLNEHGIAQVAALRSMPAFDLEEELALAREFTLEPAVDDKGKARPQVLSRDQLVALVGAKAADPEHDEHED
jgi:hypothetical protein